MNIRCTARCLLTTLLAGVVLASPIYALEPVSLVPRTTCPACGQECTDLTFVASGKNGVKESDCEHRTYGYDLAEHTLDVYQAVCHNCPSMAEWQSVQEGVLSPDYPFTVTQARQTVICHGRNAV